MRRFIDIVVSAIGLVLCLPLVAVIALVVWTQDGGAPFYAGERVGRSGRRFRLIKLRTMVADADRGGSSSGADDARITGVGRFLRRTKIDELPQLWHVLQGTMSLVGPRPQVPWAVEDYTDAERRLLDASPGITDPASVVFSDEAEILLGAADPDLRYSQVIRPWKSRLSLLYVVYGNTWSYMALVAATLIQTVSRPRALAVVDGLLRRWGADPDLLAVARREGMPPDAPPPGATAVVGSVAPSGPTTGPDKVDGRR